MHSSLRIAISIFYGLLATACSHECQLHAGVQIVIGRPLRFLDLGEVLYASDLIATVIESIVPIHLAVFAYVSLDSENESTASSHKRVLIAVVMSCAAYVSAIFLFQNSAFTWSVATALYLTISASISTYLSFAMRANRVRGSVPVTSVEATTFPVEQPNKRPRP